MLENRVERSDLMIYHATAASCQLEVAVAVDVDVEKEVDTEIENIGIFPHLNFVIAACVL